jgi:hypothetical protein
LAIVLVGAFLAYSYVHKLMVPVPLTISYATNAYAAMPNGASCAGGNDESTGIAKEILNLETYDIFVVGGSNAMSTDTWTNYRFYLPIMKNSTRQLLFNGSCFFRSPDVAATGVGDGCFSLQDIVANTTRSVSGSSWIACSSCARTSSVWKSGSGGNTNR